MPKYTFSSIPKNNEKTKPASSIEPKPNSTLTNPAKYTIKKAFGLQRQPAPSNAITPSPSLPSIPVSPLDSVYSLVLSGNVEKLNQYFANKQALPIEDGIRDLITSSCQKNALIKIYKSALHSLLTLVSKNITAINPDSDSLTIKPVLNSDISRLICDINEALKECFKKQISVTELESSYSSIAKVENLNPPVFKEIKKSLSEIFLVSSYEFNSIVLSNNLLEQKDYYEKLEAKKLKDLALNKNVTQTKPKI